MADEDKDIPASGAVFTFGRSRFADNIPSHFFIRNDPIINVDCGDEHTTVVCQNGRVFAFGNNEWGQLGLGHRSVVTKPSCVKSLKPEQAIHIACGKAHTIISTASGKLFGCGSNSEGQLGLGDCDDRVSPSALDFEGSIEQLAAGCHHSVALNNKGEVFVWGSNADGQLGLGPDVKTATSPSRLPLKESIAKIACGYYHTILLTEEGQVLVCGEGESGKLGLGSSESVFTPTPVNVEAWLIQVAAGGNHTLALAVDGKVYGWGSNLSGQLGLPLNSYSEVVAPTVVQSLADHSIKVVACGESHSAFITESGELLTVGDTRHGKLGCEVIGSEANCNPEPTKVPRFRGYTVTKARCGGCHTMVLATPDAGEGDDLLSNGHAPTENLQPPEVDILSPPIGARGPLPPLQRVPHINSSSTEDKSSEENLLANDPQMEVESVLEDMLELTAEPVEENELEEIEKESSISTVEEVKDTILNNEDISKPQLDGDSILIPLKNDISQAFDALKNESEGVIESCETAISGAKSTVDKTVDKVVNNCSGVAEKISSNIQKKSKMCTLL